ncbi:MAG: hypothetical protein JXL97_13350 [Bacteroidales bacterium]|nr:hypothetical protein [Bacteroidales bacterium]
MKYHRQFKPEPYNIMNYVEVESSMFSVIIFSFFNANAKVVFPLSAKINFGGGYSTTLEIVPFILLTTKTTSFVGLTLKKEKSINSFNVSYDQFFSKKALADDVYCGADYTHRWRSISLSYVNIWKLNKNWSSIFDTKLFITTVHIDVPEEVGYPAEMVADYDLQFIENFTGIKYHKWKHSFDMGLLYYVGSRKEDILFAPIPYLKYSVIF